MQNATVVFIIQINTIIFIYLKKNKYHSVYLPVILKTFIIF